MGDEAKWQSCKFEPSGPYSVPLAHPQHKIHFETLLPFCLISKLFPFLILQNNFPTFQVRLGQVLDNGKVKTKQLGEHQGRVHSLAVEPGSPYVFYSCGEDGFVQHVC